MTREEAIEVLNGILKLNYREWWDDKCDEAVDMAIGVLSAASDDLISRADAIEAICEDCYEDCSKGIHQMGCQTIETLKALPSADRPKGEWISTTSGEHYKCSHCGTRASYWFNEENSCEYSMDMSEWLSDYCPNCGADNRGGEHE